MSVNTYQKGQNIHLTDHFTLSEFQCKGKNCGCTQVLHDSMLSCYLEMIRNHFGKPLIVTSGFRCKKHNASVGGASASLHTKGQAADFYINGVAPEKIAAFAESIGIKGIGLYGPEDGNFVHIDTRTAKTFWYGHQQESRETFCDHPKESPLYVVTCRFPGTDTICALVFDQTAGEAIQSIPHSTAAIRMTMEQEHATFTPISIGADRVEIVKVRKVEL